MSAPQNGAPDRTMQRRKFLATVGSLAAGSAAAIGTGAVTTMSADRTAEVRVADDSESYVGLEPISDSPHSGFVEGFTETDPWNGGPENKIMLNFSDNNSPYYFGGDGVNPDSIYKFDDVFRISNFSSTNLDVWITSTSNLSGVDFYVVDDTRKSIVYNGEGTPPLAEIPSRAASFAPSDSLKVGVEIDGSVLNEGNVGEILGDITIHAVNSTTNR